VCIVAKARRARLCPRPLRRRAEGIRCRPPGPSDVTR
jgi:hypothetical protein